jgi:16S rRNA (uracil1498-N3)-methyltransferase
MTIHRFYLPRRQLESEGLLLKGSEAHHCHDVLRLREGARIILFDGEGSERVCKIESASSKEVRLLEVQKQRTAGLPFRMTLAQAIPKGKTMDTIIHKATELGVHRIVPVTSERTVVRVEGDAKDGEAKRERWREIVIEAAKLSGNNWLPEVDRPRTVRELASDVRNHDLAVVGSLQPGSRFLKDYLDEYTAEKKKLPSSILICIGPEGDYTPAEVGQLIGAGCRPITLGQVVLKSDTAAIYALSTVAYELQTRKP